MFNPGGTDESITRWYPDNLYAGDTPYAAFEDIEVMIFDRYGRLLAEYSGALDRTQGLAGWDGTYNGKELPTGDYWYHIVLNDDKGRVFTGHFTLYRNTN